MKLQSGLLQRSHMLWSLSSEACSAYRQSSCHCSFRAAYQKTGQTWQAIGAGRPAAGLVELDGGGSGSGWTAPLMHASSSEGMDGAQLAGSRSPSSLRRCAASMQLL